MNGSFATFRAARDFLLAHRGESAAARAGFRWPELGQFNWALDWFDAIAQGERSDQPALWVVNEDRSETRFTFAELAAASAQVANYFRGLGLKRGERLLVMLGNVPALWQTLLAAMKLGVVVVPTTTLLSEAELRDRIERAEVSAVIAGPAETARLSAVAGKLCRIVAGGADIGAGWQCFGDFAQCPANFDPGYQADAADLVQLYFTSGTTSRPKIVPHSHASYGAGHLSTMYWLGLQPGDVHCNVSSPGWAKHAWSCFFAPWNAEATVFALNQPRFQARRLLEELVRCQVTTFCAPPTVWRMLVLEDLASYKVKLRELASAGEPLNPEVITQVSRAWGLTIRDGYGQTETTAQVANPPGEKIKLGAMGKPLPGYEVVLLNATGEASDEGELCLPLDPPPLGLTSGHGQQGPIYRTGDVVARDQDGYLTFVGRADDVFKASDYRISPFELESAMIEHPDVVECAVIPSPDLLRLAVPKAFIVLRAGVAPSRATALEMFRHSRKMLAPYKRIRRIAFSELPKTISGKIRRVELRQAEAAHSSRPADEFCEQDFPELKSEEKGS